MTVLAVDDLRKTYGTGSDAVTAVDGVTRLAEPTVDGLPFATYIQPWDSMRQLLGLRR